VGRFLCHRGLESLPPGHLDDSNAHGYPFGETWQILARWLPSGTPGQWR
jgi:hypothetical protein